MDPNQYFSEFKYVKERDDMTAVFTLLKGQSRCIPVV